VKGTKNQTTNDVEVVSLSDYTDFGMVMNGRSFVSSDNYRYGYQGSEKDPEGHGGLYTTDFRGLDVRIGRWLSPDPITHTSWSPYVSMNDNPIALTDPWGLDPDPEVSGPDDGCTGSECSASDYAAGLDNPGGGSSNNPSTTGGSGGANPAGINAANTAIINSQAGQKGGTAANPASVRYTAPDGSDFYLKSDAKILDVSKDGNVNFPCSNNQDIGIKVAEGSVLAYEIGGKTYRAYYNIDEATFDGYKLVEGLPDDPNARPSPATDLVQNKGGGGYNIDAAVKHLNANVIYKKNGKTYWGGACSPYVPQAINAGFGDERIPTDQAGGSYGDELEAAGFTDLKITDLDKYVPQKGDIAVMDGPPGAKGCNTSRAGAGEPCGHIQMYNGKKWRSDFDQTRKFWPGKDYQEAKPQLQFKIYRWNGPANKP
jgi:RHS repeat-associated protein